MRAEMFLFYAQIHHRIHDTCAKIMNLNHVPATMCIPLFLYIRFGYQDENGVTEKLKKRERWLCKVKDRRISQQ